MTGWRDDAMAAGGGGPEPHASHCTTKGRANGRAWKQMSGVQGVQLPRAPPARFDSSSWQSTSPPAPKPQATAATTAAAATAAAVWSAVVVGAVGAAVVALVLAMLLLLLLLLL